MDYDKIEEICDKLKTIVLFGVFRYFMIRWICKKYFIRNWSINPVTGLVDVNGSVYLSWKSLTEIPLSFGEVTDSFSCFGNNLTSLKGCPASVGVRFSCFDNNLTSLKGCPTYVGHNFYCTDNNITERHNIPNVDGKIHCDKSVKWIF
jgi:hypothetical protein